MQIRRKNDHAVTREVDVQGCITGNNEKYWWRNGVVDGEKILYSATYWERVPQESWVPVTRWYLRCHETVRVCLPNGAVLTLPPGVRLVSGPSGLAHLEMHVGEDLT
jgi:hypothetical protein